MLRVVHIVPGRLPAVAVVSEQWPSLERLVGGELDCVRLGDDLQLWANEEGIALGLAPNREVPHVGVVHGAFFVVGRTPEGWIRSLSAGRARALVAEAERWALAGVPPA